MTISYKNLLLIERISHHYDYICKTMNISFDDPEKPFRYENPHDMLVFYFENNVNPIEPEFKVINNDFNMDKLQYSESNNKLFGILKLYSD